MIDDSFATWESFGAGRCGCCGGGAIIDHLMCRACWQLVPRPTQHAVYRLLGGYRSGRIPLGDLRAVQERAIREARRRATPGGPERR